MKDLFRVKFKYKTRFSNLLYYLGQCYRLFFILSVNLYLRKTGTGMQLQSKNSLECCSRLGKQY